MNAFLADAKATTLSIKQDDVPRLQWGFKFFRYFDEERLPQAKLQECLATQYDEIVNLGIVKCGGLGEGDPEAGDSGQCERPRKRARVED
ncbi:hypothetical protein LTR74_017769 [Friedmanniomyces endolithicus]|nr:hypothetical protein LTR74_017769 [Friedmanniomyces endolithicus]